MRETATDHSALSSTKRRDADHPGLHNNSSLSEPASLMQTTQLPLYADLPTPEEIRRWDEATETAFGIPPLLLMENAARAAAEVLKKHVPLMPDSKVLVFMGKGNNGGDGAALARLLSDEAGCRVLVCLSAPVDKLPSPAKEHALIAEKMGVLFQPPSEAGEFSPALPEWLSPDVVVDALLGVGFHGELRARERALVRTMNTLGKKAFLFALDIPSGMNGHTGKPQPECVCAHATVCFEAAKPGLCFPEAARYTGVLSVRRIGVPLAVRERIPSSWALLAPRPGDWVRPSSFRHKGDAGRVLIIGGSAGMAGAPMLAAQGCLRAGAGLVHVAVPKDLEAAARANFPEVLSHPVGLDASWHERDSKVLLELMRGLMPHALVIGPGMGRTPAVRAILQTVLSETGRPPAVLDADALWFFRSGIDNTVENSLPLELCGHNDILTPHPGEMARMLPPSFFVDHAGLPEGDEMPPAHASLVQLDRPAAVHSFIDACRAVLVLKGAGTLIGSRGRPLTLAPFATPTLAVGGSGDVLSGVCAALLASRLYSGFDAACLGVYLHGRAGKLLEQTAPAGHLAGEIAHTVPQVWNELCGR